MAVQFSKLYADDEGRPCGYCGFPVYGEAVSKTAGDDNKRQAHYHPPCALLAGLVTREQVMAWYADGHGRVDEFSADNYFARLGGWPG